MTWWLNTAFFIRIITTVIKSITLEFLADAQIVGTPELIDRAVARLLTCRKITTLLHMACNSSWKVSTWLLYLYMYVTKIYQS